MKSNICKLSGEDANLQIILAETEKCTSYNGESPKDSMRIRLLAEELVSMLPVLLKKAEGTYWLENDGKDYELHLSVKARFETLDDRDRLIAVSSSGKNAASVGIMGKIRTAAEWMLYPSDDVALGMSMGMMNIDSMANDFTMKWSIRQYAAELEQVKYDESKSEEWDELEKSIIANLADDVIVGIRGKQVDIIVRKKI